MAYINFTNLWRTPLVATFDLHGTLLVSTWRTTFQETYVSLKPESSAAEATRWVDDNAPGTDENSLMSKLSQQVQQPFEVVKGKLTEIRLKNATDITATLQPGVQRFLDSFLDIGTHITLYVSTHTRNRDAVLKQMVESGLLGHYVDEDKIYHRSPQHSDNKHIFRDNILSQITKKHPNARHIFFNNTPDGMKKNTNLGGITVGVITGDKPELGLSNEMIHSGAHFIIEDWRQAVPLLAINGLDEGLHLFTNPPPLPGLSLVSPPIGLR